MSEYSDLILALRYIGGTVLIAGGLVALLWLGEWVVGLAERRHRRDAELTPFDLFLEDLEREAEQQLNAARDAYPTARDANGRTAAEEAQDHAHWGSGEWDQVIPGQRRPADIEETP